MKKFFFLLFLFVVQLLAAQDRHFGTVKPNVEHNAELTFKTGGGVLYFPCASMLRLQFDYSWVDETNGKTSNGTFDTGDKRFMPHPVPLISALEMEGNFVAFTFRVGGGVGGDHLRGGWGYAGLGYNFYYSLHGVENIWDGPLVITPSVNVSLYKVESELGSLDNTNRDIAMPSGVSYYYTYVNGKDITANRLSIDYCQDTWFVSPTLSLHNNMHNHALYFGADFGYWIPFASKGHLEFFANEKYYLGKVGASGRSANGYNLYSNGESTGNPHAVRTGVSALLRIGFNI